MGPVKPPAESESGQPGQKLTVPGAAPKQLNAVPGTVEPPVPAESLVRRTAQKAVSSAQPALTVSSFFSNLSDSPPAVFKQSAVVLGLPQDTLSFTLIALTRLFSLPMDSGFLTGLRREVVAAGTSSPKNSAEKTKTEALALAAASAAAKGTGLSPEALDEYAAALSPGYQFDGHQDADSQNNGNGSGNQQDDESGEGKSGATGLIDAGEIQRRFEEFMESGEKDGLLSYLNQIPAKDGRRWVVWPFKISIEGVDLRVFIRILKKEGPLPDRLIADVFRGEPRPTNLRFEASAGVPRPLRRWRFIVDEAGREGLKAEISVFPGLPPGELKVLQKEAERAFAGLCGEVRVLNGGDESSPGIFFPDEVLPSVNEEA
jgi:hypothetical protein